MKEDSAGAEPRKFGPEGIYLRHTLSLLDIRAEIVASTGGESLQRLGRIDENTLVIVLSVGPRAPAPAAGDEARPAPRRAHPGDLRRDSMSEVGEHAEMTLYFSSNSPSFTRSNTALMALVQALAHGLYARDEDRAPGPHQRLQTEVRPDPRSAGPGHYAGQPSPLPNMSGMPERATFRLKTGLAEMLKGGVIMDVVTPEEAKIAEEAGRLCGDGAGARARRHPPRRRRRADVGPGDDQGDPGGGDDPGDGQGADRPLRRGPGPAGARSRLHRRVGGADPGRRGNHIDKFAFEVPFVCGATNLGEALRRLGEGAAMIRSKGEAGTGNVVEAVRHMREITAGIKRLAQLRPRGARRRRQGAPGAARGRPRGGRGRHACRCRCSAPAGIATPADAALMMQLGAEGNFVGSGIFKSSDPERRARAIVEATTHFEDPERVAAASIGLGEAMPGLEIGRLAAADALLQNRGA